MSNSFANQDAGADRPVGQQGQLPASTSIARLKKLDEEVARLHLEKIGVKLTTLTAGTGPTTSACQWKARTSEHYY